MQRVLALGMVLAIGVVLVFTVSTNLLPFGSFPMRKIGENFENSIGQQILENAPLQTGAPTVGRCVVGGYRGNDTLGLVRVLFAAVVGVVTIFRTFRRRE